MKILVVGASGTIGRAVVERLGYGNEIVSAGSRAGDVIVDLASPESISTMFEDTGAVDAIVCTAGQAAFGPLATQSDDDYRLALDNKLMGQVNLVRRGTPFVNAGGSITLTSGTLSREPMPESASVAMVNGALESFARAAALEVQDVRVNVVAPSFVKETMDMMGMDSSSGISAADTANAYAAAVEGRMHGDTLDAADYV